MARYCSHCLYDLSATTEPRCSEYGRAFNPRDRRSSTLPSANIALWAMHHLRLAAHESVSAWLLQRRTRAFCRKCYTDLSKVRLNHHCPVCGTWFEISDRSTYSRGNHALARVYDRFRHVCVWRGVLIALALLIYGLVCIATQHALLPGAGNRYHTARLLPLDRAPEVMMGIAWLGAALALHSRYFWGRVEPIWRFADLGLIAGIIMIVIGWGYALCWAIRHMMN